MPPRLACLPLLLLLPARSNTASAIAQPTPLLRSALSARTAKGPHHASCCVAAGCLARGQRHEQKVRRVVPMLNAVGAAFNTIQADQDSVKHAVRQQLAVLKTRVSTMHEQNVEMTSVLKQTSSALQDTLAETSRLSCKVQDLTSDLAQRDSTATALGGKVRQLETNLAEQNKQLAEASEAVARQSYQLESLTSEALCAHNAVDAALQSLEHFKTESLEVLAEKDSQISKAEAFAADAAAKVMQLEEASKLKEEQLMTVANTASSVGSSVELALAAIESLKEDTLETLAQKDSAIASAEARAADAALKAAQLEATVQEKQGELAAKNQEAEIARATAAASVEEMQSILGLITEMKSILDFE
ncbi:MAG: hypothetical protein SGPRY_014438 [Prymnesium sp.]